ncbi:MAG TPA: hypothetical protein V6D33_16375 [Cyanophyceae cyanobacterium]
MLNQNLPDPPNTDTLRNREVFHPSYGKRGYTFVESFDDKVNGSY